MAKRKKSSPKEDPFVGKKARALAKKRGKWKTFARSKRQWKRDAELKAYLKAKMREALNKL